MLQRKIVLTTNHNNNAKIDKQQVFKCLKNATQQNTTPRNTTSNTPNNPRFENLECID